MSGDFLRKVPAWIKNEGGQRTREKRYLKLLFVSSDGEHKTKSMGKFAFYGKQNSSDSL